MTPARGSFGATAGLTAIAMLAFAGNSLLCRLALARHAVDPTTFAAVRFGSGALALVAMSAVRHRRLGLGGRPDPRAVAGLVVYALAFTFAYLGLPAGTGALVLFASVQLTMIGGGLASGTRPRPAEWVGLAIALGGLVALVAPGLSAPPPLATALMAVAGAGWGVYSLAGRRARDPLDATTGNFVLAAAVLLLAALLDSGRRHVSPGGLELAVASGVVASALGYAIWYAAVPRLAPTHAAIVQLVVPVLSAALGVVLLGEQWTARLVGSGLAILAGLGVAIAFRAPRVAPR